MAYTKELPAHIKEVTVVNADGSSYIAPRVKFEPVLTEEEYVEKCKNESWRYIIKGTINGARTSSSKAFLSKYEGNEIEKVMAAISEDGIEALQVGDTDKAIRIFRFLTELSFDKPKTVTENRNLIANINIEGDEFKNKWKRLQSLKENT